MTVIFLVIFIIALVVGGGLGQEYIKTNKESNRLFRADMNAIKERMNQLETEMAELKELVSDTIIEKA